MGEAGPAGAAGVMDKVADAGELDGAGWTCRRGNKEGEGTVGEAAAGDTVTSGARLGVDGDGCAAADGERPTDCR